MLAHPASASATAIKPHVRPAIMPAAHDFESVLFRNRNCATPLIAWQLTVQPCEVMMAKKMKRTERALRRKAGVSSASAWDTAADFPPLLELRPYDQFSAAAGQALAKGPASEA